MNTSMSVSESGKKQELELLNTSESADFLKISVSKFKSLVYDGLFTVFPLGRRNYYSVEELRKYIDLVKFNWKSKKR